MEQSTLLPGDTLASHSVLPGTEKAQTMTAISGRKFLELFSRQDPAGCCVKMLLGTSQWVSTKCLMTWRGLGTPVRHRLSFQLVPWANGRRENGSGLLPTVRASSCRYRKWYIRKRHMSNLEELPMVRGYEWLNGKPINPQWLEWHMGYPIGWTELADSETQSSRKSQPKSSAVSSPSKPEPPIAEFARRTGL